MILDHHPAYGPDTDRTVSLGSGTRMLRDLRAIGYWRSPEQPFLPDPRAFVDPSWDADERAAVIAYLRAGETGIIWCGTSSCRFNCSVEPDSPAVAELRVRAPEVDVARLARLAFDKEVMGNRCLTDGTFIWPEGFAHYLEAHDVRPPEEFVEHVRARAAGREASGEKG